MVWGIICVSIVILLVVVGHILGQIDEEKQKRLDEELAAGTDHEAQFNRGKELVLKDYKKAHDWFALAKANGSKKATLGVKLCFNIIANNRTEVKCNGHASKTFEDLRACTYFTPADPKICYKLGAWVYDGFMLPDDSAALFLVDEFPYWNEGWRMEQAAGWFKRAADEGSADAVQGLFEIGEEYRINGVDGESPDKEKAREFLLQAASYGHADAKARLLELERE
jgi:TPR repeat protein